MTTVSSTFPNTITTIVILEASSFLILLLIIIIIIEKGKTVAFSFCCLSCSDVYVRPLNPHCLYICICVFIYLYLCFCVFVYLKPEKLQLSPPAVLAAVMLTPDHLDPHWSANTGLWLVERIRWSSALLWLVEPLAVLPGPATSAFLGPVQTWTAAWDFPRGRIHRWPKSTWTVPRESIMGILSHIVGSSNFQNWLLEHALSNIVGGKRRITRWQESKLHSSAKDHYHIIFLNLCPWILIIDLLHIFCKVYADLSFDEKGLFFFGRSTFVKFYRKI